tara:strand:- start:143 stop:316 length:174 start_codon:yes stop_codon:yes gene_type:complete
VEAEQMLPVLLDQVVLLVQVVPVNNLQVLALMEQTQAIVPLQPLERDILVVALEAGQ